MKFTPSAQNIFTKVYNQAIDSQIKIKHPDMPMVDQKHWQAICYNFASIAASAYEGYTLVVEGKDLDK